MRVVVDTNVFVSAALKSLSWPSDTVRWIETYGGLLKTAITEQEVMAVLQRPRLAPKITRPFLGVETMVAAFAETVRRMRAGEPRLNQVDFPRTC